MGELDHPEVRTAAQRVREAARATGVACGVHVVHPSSSAVQAALQDDYTVLALGVDMIFLREAVSAAIKEVTAGLCRPAQTARVRPDASSRC